MDYPSKFSLNVQKDNATHTQRDCENFITHLMRLSVDIREAPEQVEKWIEREREYKEPRLEF